MPDALMALSRLLATLHDDNGDVAVEGLVSKRGRAAGLPGGPVPRRGRRARRRPAHRHRPPRRPASGPSPPSRCSAIDAPTTDEAPNAIVPKAKAKLSMRLAPGDNPKSAYEALKAHLEKHVPWGAKISFEFEHDGNPCVIDSTGKYFDAARAAFKEAWDGTDAGRHRRRRLDPVHRHVPGDVPRGVDPGHRASKTRTPRHTGPNESLHLGEFARVCLAEALLLRNVALSPMTPSGDGEDDGDEGEGEGDWLAEGAQFAAGQPEAGRRTTPAAKIHHWNAYPRLSQSFSRDDGTGTRSVDSSSASDVGGRHAVGQLARDLGDPDAPRLPVAVAQLDFAARTRSPRTRPTMVTVPAGAAGTAASAAGPLGCGGTQPRSTSTAEPSASSSGVRTS